ncbi:unnamed protein product [Periconia digitata]|uniref:Uncharacterized protein n=1 Tax=Periconia digitata TaxID=1303443 RepID=A0A9W4UDV4_9PLEO|nr:unnamed protein product [Periconia digitata]
MLRVAFPAACLPNNRHRGHVHTLARAQWPADRCTYLDRHTFLVNERRWVPTTEAPEWYGLSNAFGAVSTQIHAPDASGPHDTVHHKPSPKEHPPP